MLGLLFAVSLLPADYIPAGRCRSNRTACNAEVFKIDELLVCDRPIHAFFLTFFTRGFSKFMFAIMLHMHWGHTRVRNGFCGIARTHVSYNLLHPLGQYPTSELLLWGPK